MTLELPEGPFKAYLFDCDGTIADSMPLHYVAWRRALGEWGCAFPEDIFYAWGGLPAAEIIAKLGAQQGLALPVDEVAERKESLYYELLPQLRAVPEVLEQIQLGHGKIPFAVVSGSTRESVTRSLEVLPLNWAPWSCSSLGIFGWRGVPLKSMCSSRCAIPVSP